MTSAFIDEKFELIVEIETTLLPSWSAQQLNRFLDVLVVKGDIVDIKEAIRAASACPK